MAALPKAAPARIASWRVFRRAFTRLNAETANKPGWQKIGRFTSWAVPTTSAVGFGVNYLIGTGVNHIGELAFTLGVAGGIPALASALVVLGFRSADNTRLAKVATEKSVHNADLRRQNRTVTAESKRKVLRAERKTNALEYRLWNHNIPIEETVRLEFLPEIKDDQDRVIQQEFKGYNLFRSHIADGGLASVFHVKNYQLQPRAGKDVALKIIHPSILLESTPKDLQEVKERFEEREIAAMDSLREHPNVVTIYSTGKLSPQQYFTLLQQAGHEETEQVRASFELLTEPVPYLLMELIDGVDLEDRINSEKPSTEEAVRITLDIARAMKSINEDHDIVHRDLKPENIFVIPHETSPWGSKIKIGDFGLATFVREGDARKSGSNLTQLAQVMGTPRYMSPEQWLGSGDIDKLADQYAVGVMLYKMLTGKLPVVSDTEDEEEVKQLDYGARIMGGSFINIRERMPEIPEELARIVHKMIAKDKKDRFEKWDDCIAQLDQALKILIAQREEIPGTSLQF